MPAVALGWKVVRLEVGSGNDGEAEDEHVSNLLCTKCSWFCGGGDKRYKASAKGIKVLTSNVIYQVQIAISTYENNPNQGPRRIWLCAVLIRWRFLAGGRQWEGGGSQGDLSLVNRMTRLC